MQIRIVRQKKSQSAAGHKPLFRYGMKQEFEKSVKSKLWAVTRWSWEEMARVNHRQWLSKSEQTCHCGTQDTRSGTLAKFLTDKSAAFAASSTHAFLRVGGPPPTFGTAPAFAWHSEPNLHTSWDGITGRASSWARDYVLFVTEYFCQRHYLWIQGAGIYFPV